MKMPEILAPAGGFEQLTAAVRCGADAVYLGTDAFNARQNADNFGGEKLAEAVSYCHACNVRVYAAMNTLITDEEYPQAVKNAELIAKSGCDAVIVQDLAVARLFRDCCPDMPLHASTQMSIHNVSGLKALEKLGFRRVVPARELSLEEIRTLADSTDMEIEVFVHGALCMSVSGMCYLSSMIGGRSGNRGRCAQPCRLDFNCGGRDHALSLKDSSLISHIGELAAAGVDSLKIEGRMKRPEYAAASVESCVRARDGLEYDEASLRSVFSRSGFTDGYYTGRRTLDMFGYRKKEDVTAADSVLSQLALKYKDEKQTVGTDIHFHADENSSSVTVSDGTNTATVGGCIPDKALNKALDGEFAKKCFSKTGGTVFGVRNFTYDITDGLSLSASAMNTMRREALDKLYAMRAEVSPKSFTMPEKENTVITARSRTEPEIRLRFSHAGQIFDDGNTAIILPFEEILSHTELISRFGNRLIAELPALVFPDSENIFEKKLERLAESGVKQVYCENIGVMNTALGHGFSVHSGCYANVMNSTSASEYSRLGVSSETLSLELMMDSAKTLKTTVPKGVAAYGFMPLMRFRACPAQTVNGCGDCKGLTVIKDRFGTDFRIICSGRKYSSLLNSVPLYIGDKNLDGLDFVTLYFTFEKKEVCEKVYSAFVRHESLPAKKTGGLYYRGVL